MCQNMVPKLVGHNGTACEATTWVTRHLRAIYHSWVKLSTILRHKAFQLDSTMRHAVSSSVFFIANQPKQRNANRRSSSAKRGVVNAFIDHVESLGKYHCETKGLLSVGAPDVPIPPCVLIEDDFTDDSGECDELTAESMKAPAVSTSFALAECAGSSTMHVPRVQKALDAKTF